MIIYQDIYQKISWFQSKDPSFFSKIAPLLKKASYKKNDNIFFEGDPVEESKEIIYFFNL